MGLSDYRVTAVVAVSDMEAAKEFYEGKLGLSGGTDEEDGGRTYQCGGGTEVHIYPSAANAGKSAATLVGWDVDDLEKVVDELTSKGVRFEQYEEPLKTDERGIARTESGGAAWFRDPDGNTHGVIEAG
jgi:catechol 2,3-dioxygenase-like lactoylglutathione lyase family enzyme